MGERKLFQLVEATWGITNFIGHFEIEQLFEEGCSFCIGEDVGELGEAQVATVAEYVEYLATEGRDMVFFEVEGLLDGSRLTGGLPIHGIEEVLCAGNQTCPVETDEPIATIAAVVGDTAWEGEYIPTIVKGNGCCDKRATFLLALGHEDCIGETCYYAIASQEVASFERGTGDILGEKATRRGIFDGDTENGEMEIGQIASAIKQVEPVSVIMNRLIKEYNDARAAINA